MITLDDLISINKAICEDNNQQSVVINESNLLSALSVQGWYENKYEKSAALIRSITIGHGFQDGNKRTAACLGMIIADYECYEETLIGCILDIAKGQLKDVEAISKLLYPNSYK